MTERRPPAGGTRPLPRGWKRCPECGFDVGVRAPRCPNCRAKYRPGGGIATFERARRRTRWVQAGLVVLVTGATVGLLARAVSGGGSPWMPDPAEFEVLEAGRPALDSTVAHVTAVLGPPDETEDWHATTMNLCNFFKTDGGPPRYSGEGRALWRGVPASEVADLLGEVAAQWETAGVEIRVSDPTHLSGDQSGGAQRFKAVAHLSDHENAFVVTVESGCYTRAGLEGG